jgi:hypothetical protein
MLQKALVREIYVRGQVKKCTFRLDMQDNFKIPYFVLLYEFDFLNFFFNLVNYLFHYNS